MIRVVHVVVVKITRKANGPAIASFGGMEPYVILVSCRLGNQTEARLFRHSDK